MRQQHTFCTAIGIVSFLGATACDDSAQPILTQSPAEDVRQEALVEEGAFSRTALLIDDYRASGLTDCDHDAVVQNIVEFAVEPHLADGEELDLLNVYDSVGCAESSIPREVELEQLLPYKTLFWNVAPLGNASAISRVTESPLGNFGEERHILRKYVQAGGNLVVWGRSTIPELLGQFYPDGPFEPDIPIFPNPNFGPGTFVYDLMRLRVQIDRPGRGTVPGLELECSGLVALEPTDLAIRCGLPAGIEDPTDYSDRKALWLNQWSGYHNERGSRGASGLRASPSPHGSPHPRVVLLRSECIRMERRPHLSLRLAVWLRLRWPTYCPGD